MTATTRYIVVESRLSHVAVAARAPGVFEDSSCQDAPQAPAVFDSLASAQAAADALCVDSGGFVSYWTPKALPLGCTLQGMALFELPELADERRALAKGFA